MKKGEEEKVFEKEERNSDRTVKRRNGRNTEIETGVSRTDKETDKEQKTNRERKEEDSREKER